MANTIAYAQIFQANLDKLMVAEATTGWMELNADQVQYNGGDTVNIPDVVFKGLSDYDRNTGFKGGGVTLVWTPYKLTQDRGTTFSIDAMDVDETAFVLQAGNLMAEFQRTVVVPEVDAYRYSKLAKKDATNIVDFTIAKATPTDAEATGLLTSIQQSIAELKDIAPTGSQLVLTMTSITRNFLNLSDRFNRLKNTTVISKGGVDYTVDSLDDVAIVTTPSARFFEDFTPGVNGAAATTDKPLAYLLTATTVPIAISKTEKIRIFSPDVNQTADAWKLDYRKYHDLWVMKNKSKCIRGARLKITTP